MRDAGFGVSPWRQGELPFLRSVPLPIPIQGPGRDELQRWRCRSGAVPATGGESSSGALQPAPSATAASVPKPPVENKSLSLLSAVGATASVRNLAGGFEPIVPQPPPLALPSLPRKMETGDEGTFLRCIQLCPLPDYHHDIILTCKL